MSERFNEQSLRDDIVAQWGEYGAHIDVFDWVLTTRADWKKLATHALYDLLDLGVDIEKMDGVTQEVIDEVIRFSTYS